MEKLLTLKEVNDIFNLKDQKGRYVKKLKSKGLLKGARIGNKLFFKESDVIAFIENEFRKQN